MHPRKRTASTAATALLSVADAKRHLRVTDAQEDVEVAALVGAAVSTIEREAELSFLTQTWEMKLDAFWDGWLSVPYPPLSSVTSITYLDGDGASQTLAAAVYQVDTHSRPGRIRLAYGQSWPATRSVSHAVTVTAVCGFGATGSSVPAGLVHAVKLMVGHLYEHREAVLVGAGAATALPDGVADLIRREWIPEADVA